MTAGHAVGPPLFAAVLGSGLNEFFRGGEIQMSESFIARMCAKFRAGMVKVCVTIGTALIVITVAAITLPFVLGMLLLAWAQRASQRDSQPEFEKATIVVVPAGS